MFRKLLVFVFSGFVIAGAAVASAGTEPSVDRKDYQILKDVAREVRRYVNYTVFDNVDVSIENGTVRLAGKVTMPYKRDDVERRVSRVAGVNRVVNEIEVLPVSQFDEELRYRISRAIYGNPSFWHYASMVNPPIHIVVDRGHVTLTGVVQSNVERMLARSIATSFGAFSVTNDLKTDAEVQAALERIAD